MPPGGPGARFRAGLGVRSNRSALGRSRFARSSPVGERERAAWPTVRTRPSSHPEPGNRKKPSRGGGLTDRCSYCSGPPLAPHPDLLPSDAERGVGPHDRMSAGDDAPALDFVLEIYPLFETAGKGCQERWSFTGRSRGVSPESGYGFPARSGTGESLPTPMETLRVRQAGGYGCCCCF